MNILLWGMGQEFLRYVSTLKRMEQLGEITICGVVSEDTYTREIMGIRHYMKDEVIEILDGIQVILLMGVSSLIGEFRKEIPMRLAGITKVPSLVDCHVLDIPFFTFEKYLELEKSNLSIMAQNCWGGLTYRYLRMPFSSPLINLSLNNADYFRFMRQPQKYQNLELIEVDEGYNALEKYKFPICELGDIRINMIHYRSFDEARLCWERRKERINLDNILAMTYTDNPLEAEEFDALPYRKKICFVPFTTNLESCFKVNLECFPKTQDTLADVFLSAARGRYLLYNIWDLLLEGKKVKVTK